MASKRPAKPKQKNRLPASKTRQRPRLPAWEMEPSPGRRLLITDVAFRDGHQSLLATRMRTEDLLPVAAELDKVGFWSLEVWGGATFDTCLRFLKEDPWERLQATKTLLCPVPPRTEHRRLPSLR